MKFCSNCANPISQRIPDGDDRPRWVCDACDNIYYENPKIIAGCLPEWGDRVLLCKRAIEPRYGLWTLPAGFMENGETLQQAAARETREEANARVEIGQLYTYVSIPNISQVYFIFRARLEDEDFSAGSESLEVELFDEADIPWDEIAFPSIELALRNFFSDRKKGQFELHTADLMRKPRP